MTENVEITRTVIPALPQWYVAVYFAESHSFGLDPIVAWEIERERRPYHHSVGRPGECWINHQAMPITLDGSWNEGRWNIWAVKTPDGKFDFVGDRTFEREAEALEFAKEEEQLKKKRVEEEEQLKKKRVVEEEQQKKRARTKAIV
jgi:hypothetical protein